MPLQSTATVQAEFLAAIGHIGKVFIRCLLPKDLDSATAHSLGEKAKDGNYNPLAYRKDGQLHKASHQGILDLADFSYQPVKTDGTPRGKQVKNGLAELQNFNRLGFGIYFVANDSNGFKVDEATAGLTLFHESDRATIDQQQAEIDRITQDFGQPTAVIETGKSLHTYYRLETRLDPEQWSTYQRRWLQFSNCDDASLSNVNRLMRLPGFDHVRWDKAAGEFVFKLLAVRVLNPDTCYSLEQFDRVMPVLEPTQWATVPSSGDGSNMLEIAPYLEGFNPEGRQGWATAKCPVHGGESLDSIHINTETGAFIAHCGCDPKDVYRETKIIAKADGYIPAKPRQEEQPQGEEVQELKESIQAKLSATGTDFDIERLLPVAIAQDLKTYCQRIDGPHGLMLAAVLTGYASLMHPDTVLKCFGGTNHGAKSIIWLGIYGITGSGKTHSVKPVLAALERLSRAADEAYKEALAQWKAAVRKKEAWDKAPKNNKPEEPTEKEKELADRDQPDRDKFTVNNFSIEALLNRLGKQRNRGILVFAAELVGWMLRMDPAKGEAEQNMAMWDGDRLDGDLIGRDFLAVSNPRASVMGGVQDDVLKKLLLAAEKIANGFMPRLMLLRYDERRRPEIQDCEELTFTQLNGLFARAAIDTEPKEFKFHPDCFHTYQAWDREISDLTLKESRKSIKALYPKFFTYSLRFTLIAHAIKQQVTQAADDRVTLATFQEAIAFTRFCMAQTISIYEELLGVDKDDFVAGFCRSAEVKGWISARDVQRLRSRKFKSKPEAVSFMVELASLGFAETNGEQPGTKNFKIQVFSKKTGRQATNYPEAVSRKDFQELSSPGDSLTTGDKNGDNGSEAVESSPESEILSPDLSPPENGTQPKIQPPLSPTVADYDDRSNPFPATVTGDFAGDDSPEISTDLDPEDF
jgi:Protein of unknown function (DUF3987)